MITEAQNAVHEFHRIFNLPIPKHPVTLERSRVLLRAKWMREEIDEFVNSVEMVDQVDAMADLIYYALGVFVEMGLEGGEAFRLVHRANMEKSGKDGKPIYNEEGKVVKPEGWISPRESIKQWLNSLPESNS